MTLKLFLFLPLVLISFSCNSGKEDRARKSQPDKKELADLNRYFVEKDRERIQSYIERKGLQMKEAPTGLWYMIKNEGSGEQIRGNERVMIEYKCSLLDGTECYSSDNLGPREIIIGKSKVEAGLDQGLRMLKPGGEAIFIIPPFLAYGLTGDGKKIPAKAVLVYSVKIVRPV